MSENQYLATVEKYKKYVMPTYAPNLLFLKGEGAWLWDADNRRYLDFATGISVCNLGHCHPGVTAAIQAQAAKLVHVSNLYMNEVMPRLAEKLITNGMDGVVFFCNSGAEANEGLIKFARKWGNAQGKYEIIAMENSFHGRTLATLAATGRSKYRKGFSPDMPGFKFVPFNDFEAIEEAFTEKTCAIMMEPVQGEGGIIPANPEYIRKVRQFCDEKGILLLFDEVQCGMGRTGNFYAYQTFGVEPDALSMAKAIANGMPMGAMIVKRKHSGVLQPGMHASTFGGTALVSAAALATAEAFDQENVLENCRAMGKYLYDELVKITAMMPFVTGVRACGLMIGIVLDRPAAPVVPIMLKHNLVVLTAGECVVRLLPRLNLTKEEADLGLSILKQGLEEFGETIANGEKA